MTTSTGRRIITTADGSTIQLGVRQYEALLTLAGASTYNGAPTSFHPITVTIDSRYRWSRYDNKQSLRIFDSLVNQGWATRRTAEQHRQRGGSIVIEVVSHYDITESGRAIVQPAIDRAAAQLAERRCQQAADQQEVAAAEERMAEAQRRLSNHLAGVLEDGLHGRLNVNGLRLSSNPASFLCSLADAERLADYLDELKGE